MYSLEHKKYLQKNKKEKIIIRFFQIFIIIFLLSLWEILAQLNIINTFLSSSPSRIFYTIINLFKQNNLFKHIFVTFYETIISFGIASATGLLFSALLWRYKILSKIFDPYLTIFNSLPKVALGPLIIIWVGANNKSIMLMAFLVMVFTTIISLYNSFAQTDNNKITLFETFKATKWQIFINLIIRENLLSIINILKINISLSLIGVIMGELLVSKEGLGYLIMYGSQVFNLNLVITSIFLLGLLSFIMYILVDSIKRLVKKH